MDCSEYRDDMLDVLYGEADDTVTVRLTAHTDACAACRDELEGLQGVRRALQSWESPARPAPRRFAMPSLRGLAVAASIALAFGAGLLVSRAEVRDGEVAFRFGGEKAASSEVEQKLAQVETQHRAEIEALKTSLATSPATSGSAGAPIPSADPAVVRRVVQEMIRESEARQATLLQTGFQQLAQRAEAQRRYDLAQISQGFAYLESNTRADVARTNELMSHLVRAAAPAEDGK